MPRHAARIEKKTEKMKDIDLAAWILDESDAYGQVPIASGHRRFAVLVVRHPDGGIRVLRDDRPLRRADIGSLSLQSEIGYLG